MMLDKPNMPDPLTTMLQAVANFEANPASAIALDSLTLAEFRQRFASSNKE